MTIEVKVGLAMTDLSELLSKVEAGEDVVLSRGDQPVARLVRIESQENCRAALDALKAERARQSPVSSEEIRAFRDEGRRF